MTDVNQGQEAGGTLNLAAILELIEAVEEFVTYYAGSKKSHLGNGQAYKSHSQFEEILKKLKS